MAKEFDQTFSYDPAVVAYWDAELNNLLELERTKRFPSNSIDRQLLTVAKKFVPSKACLESIDRLSEATSGSVNENLTLYVDAAKKLLKRVISVLVDEAHSIVRADSEIYT